jgi:hypothetical protein
MSVGDLPVLAGTVSTTLFVTSYLPMLVKAFRTRDLSSYSRGNLVLASVGNVVYTVYVVSLPVGPIWFLHTFYVLCTALMLLWHLQHHRRQSPDRLGDLPHPVDGQLDHQLGGGGEGGVDPVHDGERLVEPRA